MRYFILSSPREIHFLFLCFILLIGISFRPYASHAISIDAGFHLTQGDFGTEENTTYVSSALHIKGKPFQTLIAEVTVPYIYQKGTGVITVGGQTFSGASGQGFGSPARNQYGSSHNSGMPLLNLPGSGSGPGGPPSADSNQPDSTTDTTSANGLTVNKNETEQGIGDIYLSFSSDFRNSFPGLPRYIPTPDFYTGLKIPTANYEKGLGTGEYDYTLGLTLSWDLGKMGCYMFGDYTWVGDTSNTDFENLTCYGGGANYDLSPKTTLLADLSGCSALHSGISPHFSLQLGIKRKVLAKYWIHGYGMSGLNEKSADYGFGLTIGMDI